MFGYHALTVQKTGPKRLLSPTIFQDSPIAQYSHIDLGVTGFFLRHYLHINPLSPQCQYSEPHNLAAL